MKSTNTFHICLLSIILFLAFPVHAVNDALLGKENSDMHNCVLELDPSLVGAVVHDGDTLAVNSALIFDFGTNNFSDNHYEYFVVLSDGVYNGGNEYIGGTYSISIELLSLGASSFSYGDFESCFFCDNTTSFSYVGHLFLIEDTNNDDQLDFNTDPFTNGDEGSVEISIDNGITSLVIDNFIMDDGKELNGCHRGAFDLDSVISSTESFSELNSSVKIFDNPVRDNLKFKIDSHEVLQYEFSLYNSSGQRVVVGTGGALYQEINVAQIPAGIYFLRILTLNKKIALKKIIIQ